MKKLLMSIVFLGLAFFAHSRGWFTVNAEKARADLHDLMDMAFAKGGEALEKARGLADKPCHNGKELSESGKEGLEKDGLRE